MDPPRRPESGWLQNTGGNSKNQPVLAPTPDGSKITRTVPLPADLIARNRGDEKDEGATEAERAKKTAEEREKEEEICAICYDQLPEVGRGIIACGHMYCFDCIHQWCKTQNDCPGCRFVIRRIIKTLTPEEGVKEKARKEGMKQKSLSKNKKQSRAKRKAASVKTPVEGVATKVIRIRPTSLKPTPAQQRAAPHPEAPGGWMYEEAQAALRWQQQEQERAQQDRPQVRPVRAQGELAAMADSMRQAEEREAAVRDQAAPTYRPSRALDAAGLNSPLPTEEPSAVPVSSSARALAREVAQGQLAVAAVAAAATVATSTEASVGMAATVEAEAQRERMRAEERSGRSSEGGR